MEELLMKKWINNNSYFGHFESVIVAMFHDEDEAVRQKGLDQVLTILDKREQEEEEEVTQPKKKRRKTKKVVSKVRQFVKPKLAWNVPSYHNWIDNIASDQKTMPPVFEGLTREQLREAAKLGRASDLRLSKYMGTTQCVEREIKIQTEMSQQVKSQERREQESANLHWSIDRMPGWINSKQDYVNHRDDQQQEVAEKALTRRGAVTIKKK